MDSGLESVMRLDAARRKLQECCQAHGRHERVTVENAVSRVVAEPLIAERPVPHYDRATTDGYAVHAAETHEAGERSPVGLALTDKNPAPGQTAQVDTGEPLPAAADAVVGIGHTEERGDTVLVYDAVPAGENVALTGSELGKGQAIFEAGHRVRASDRPLLRAAGVSTVTCVEQPTVSVLPTGEKLVDTATEPAPGEVVESSGELVATLTDQWHANPHYEASVTDGALEGAIEAHTDHDLVVTTGGSAAGRRDRVADAVAELGDVLVHGVDINPGRSVGFGVVDETPVLLLPGNPLSCLVAAVQFLRPAIAWTIGVEPQPHATRRGQLTAKLRSSPGERTFARVRIDSASPPAVEPRGVGTPGLGASGANGWVEIPEADEGIPAGETVEVQVWER